MPDSIRRFEPILPYPSRQSVMDLFLATLERNFNVDLPDDWDDNEPFYLLESDVTSFNIFQGVLNNVINRSEPAPWLLRDLKEFEQTLVELVIGGLEDNTEGQAFLDAMRSSVVSRAQAQSNQEQHSDDAR